MSPDFGSMRYVNVPPLVLQDMQREDDHLNVWEVLIDVHLEKKKEKV